MKNLKLLLLLVSGITIAYATQSDGLNDMSGSRYLSRALVFVSSIPTVSNLILSVDPKTLPEKKNQDTLLKLQTIVYTLRTKGVCLEGYISAGLSQEHQHRFS